jgi:endonuclease/exonuclease/phosphatase family metal-dependent hydrolase
MVVRFKRVNDNVEFTVINAHLDHKGTLAREESAKLMLERARQASGDGAVFLLGDLNSTKVDPAYTILTGDQYTSGSNDTLANLEQLNQVCVSNYVNRTGQPIHTTNGSITLPTHRVIRPGQLLQQLQNGHEEKDSHFLDLSHHLETRITTKGDCHSLSGPYGFRDTFTSFGLGDESKRAPICIDFIMALDSTNVKVRHYAVLPNQFDDGLLFSDHRPVLARLNW